jgi:hypothetical protein
MLFIEHTPVAIRNSYQLRRKTPSGMRRPFWHGVAWLDSLILFHSFLVHFIFVFQAVIV